MVKLSVPFGVAIALFAESDAGGPIGNWGQLTALGVCAIVLIFIVTKMLPNIHEQFMKQSNAFAEAMARAQTEFAATADRIAQRQHDDSAELSKRIAELREHCAAARAALEGQKDE